MPRIVTPLTATQIDKAKPKAKEYNLADGQGLMLRIMPSGRKTWVFNYTSPVTHKRQSIVIGTFPIMSLAEARNGRLGNQKVLAQGLDPKLKRNDQKISSLESSKNTFQSIALEWVKIHSSKVKEDTTRRILNSFEKDIFPFIGDLPIGLCSFAIIKSKVILPIVERGSFEMARKAARKINQVMSYAVLNELIPANPVTEINKLIPASKTKNLPALTPAELPDLLRAVHFASITLQTRCMLEFQLHTIVRPGEAAKAAWEEINFENRIWTIPGHKMKMGKEHRIPLSEEVMKILEVMKPISSHRHYIFPSARNPKSHASNESVNRALKRMGFKGKTVAHGFRSLASTTLNEANFSVDVIEAALAHQDPNKVRRAYNRSDYFERRKEMMQWWSSHILSQSRINSSVIGDS